MLHTTGPQDGDHVTEYEIYHPDCESWHWVSPRPYTCDATGETFVVVVSQTPIELV